MNPATAVRQMEEREKKIFSEIDKIFIPSGAIDEFEGSTFADQVKPAEEWREDLISILRAPQEASGAVLPWKHMQLRLRPAEFTVWSGINGHGKSLILTQVMIKAIQQGEKVAIASLELHPLQTIKRMVCQNVGIAWDEITETSINRFFDGVRERLSLYTEVGDMEPHRVLALCNYCHAQGIQHVVIDSLMKCGTVEADYAGEKKFINSIQNIAKNTGLHIHLVAHSKKGRDELEVPGKFDVSGTAHITNIPDNVVTVSRNKRKEAMLSAEPLNEEIKKQPDAFLNCCKQRHGEWEGIIPLWFHRSGQFVDWQNHTMEYL